MTIEYPKSTSIVPGDETIDTDPYKCWFEYLQQIDTSKWSDDVKRDFGEIKNTTFESWWPNHKKIFTKIVPIAIEEMVTQQDLKTCDEKGWVEDPDMAVLAIHMYLPQQDIKAALDEWIDKKGLNKTGAPKFNDEFARYYELARKPDTAMLRDALRVYVAIQAEKSEREEDQRNHEGIEEELNIIDKSAWNTVRSAKNIRTQRQTISRLYRKAKQVMDAVLEGEFPVYTE